MPKEIILLRHGPRERISGQPDIKAPLIEPEINSKTEALYIQIASKIALNRIGGIFHSDSPRTLKTAEFLYRFDFTNSAYENIPKSQITDSYQIAPNGSDTQSNLVRIYTETKNTGESVNLQSFRSYPNNFQAIIEKGSTIRHKILKTQESKTHTEIVSSLIISHEIVLQAIAYAFIKTDEILNMSISELEGCKIDLENQKIYPIKHT